MNLRLVPLHRRDPSRLRRELPPQFHNEMLKKATAY